MIMLLILGFFVFEDVLRSLKYKKNKINVLNILYLFTALLGSVLVVFSTGSIKRRQQTSNRLETTEYSGTFDINRFLESLGDKILDLLNFNSFLFLIFMIVLLSVLKQNKNLIFSKTDQKPKAILFLAFAFVLTITPITVGFIASNGKVGMPKAYNLTAILFLVFLSALAYIINVYVTFKVRKKMFYLIISLPFVFYTFSYFMPENNLYRQQDQVFSGNLRASYEEEYARRQYLIETNMLYKEKVIPKLSMKYNNKVYAAHKYPKMNRYYSRAFNNGIPIYTDDNLPSPLEYTSLFLVKNNKLKPVFSQNGYNVYYNLKLHTLVIKHNKTLFNQPLTNFTIEIKSKKDTTESITVNLNDRYKKKTLYYSENPKFVATVLPRDVKQISIKEFEGFNIDIETNSLQEKITYSFPYGNIMR
ncbi:DUF6056 family protein [Mesoflavibacter sp. CH_XMU1404-2]|uniref:DUF6056 family protein n=1 Tax=Mesoflavibacter sp. CH_XMU1404-2 TaxID=3107766 RepID=UPI0038B27513